jgi:hypothetical protein
VSRKQTRSYTEIPCQSKCLVYYKAPRAPASLEMSGFGIQLRPPVVDVDDTDSFWFYVLPDYVPCTRTSAKAAREESPDPFQLAVLNTHDAVMHELRKLVSVTSFNLTEPNAALHREPRCCETHRIRNAEDRRRIKHRVLCVEAAESEEGNGSCQVRRGRHSRQRQRWAMLVPALHSVPLPYGQAENST